MEFEVVKEKFLLHERGTHSGSCKASAQRLRYGTTIPAVINNNIRLNSFLAKEYYYLLQLEWWFFFGKRI
jgi:hypothetical protein